MLPKSVAPRAESKPDISVAMCTYNGAQFVLEQLDSISHQTYLPSEIVVCDDGSTDGTIAIVRSFAASAAFPVRIFENAERLGSTRNFEQAIRLCNGAFIALADQDDIWVADKLEQSLQKLREQPATGLVFSDAEILRHDGSPTGRHLWQSFQFGEKQARQLESNDYTLGIRRRYLTGATSTLRTELRDSVLPVRGTWIHDEWLAATVPLFAEVRPIRRPLLGYRQHAAQQVGPGTVPDRRSQWRHIAQNLSRFQMSGTADRNHYQKLYQQAEVLYETFVGRPLTEKGRQTLAGYRRYADFMRFRLELPASRSARTMLVVSKIQSYLVNEGLGRFLKDLFFSHLWRPAAS